MVGGAGVSSIDCLQQSSFSNCEKPSGHGLDSVQLIVPNELIPKVLASPKYLTSHISRTIISSEQLGFAFYIDKSIHQLREAISSFSLFARPTSQPQSQLSSIRPTRVKPVICSQAGTISSWNNRSRRYKDRGSSISALQLTTFSSQHKPQDIICISAFAQFSPSLNSNSFP